MKSILFAASEGVPFIKTGGLADVVGSLPGCFDKEKYDVRVILPKYLCMRQEWKDQMKYLTHFKFAFFSKAVLSALPLIGFRPDIIHCHDWQTALIPVYLNDKFRDGEFFRDIRTVLSIHNLRYQGVWDVRTVQDITGLDRSFFTPDKMEAYGDANYLKGGIVFADRITTVSETYAKEIQTPFYGERLDGLMRARNDVLTGIVNGIDYKEYDPMTDPFVEFNYDAKSFRKEKAKNKKALQKELGLDQDERKLLVGIVSRLTDQKGFDLIAYMMDEICQQDLQLVILGTGEERYENMFRHFAWKYQGKVSANIYYSEAMSHKIYAACDSFLMPSLFEPCGLSQLMSLRYGTARPEQAFPSRTITPMRCFTRCSTRWMCSTTASVNGTDWLTAAWRWTFPGTPAPGSTRNCMTRCWIAETFSRYWGRCHSGGV